MEDRVRTGRPRVTSKRQDRLLKFLPLSNRKATSKGLKRECGLHRDSCVFQHLWEEIKKTLDAKPCKNLEELKAAILEIWENIDEDVTKKLVSSMPRRCASAIAAHGGTT